MLGGREMLDVRHRRDPSGNALYKDIMGRIAKRELHSGDRLVSSRELQKQFNISHHATTAALKRLENEGYILRRPGSGTYVREVPCRPLSSTERNSRSIRVVLSICPGHSEAHLRPLTTALDEQLASLGCSYTHIRTPPRDGRPQLLEGKGDCYIWVSPSLMPDMLPPQVPVVFVAQDMEMVWPLEAGYDIISVDSRQGGAIAGRYLKDLGCRTVAILGATDGNVPGVCPVTTLRLLGFQAGWGEKIPDRLILTANEYVVREGVRMATQILELNPLPEAVFATSDELAEGFCYAAIGRGLQPGKDIKVMGFDAQPPRSDRDVPLTSVKPPLEALGRAAAVMALQRAEDPKSVVRRLSFGCSIRKGTTA